MKRREREGRARPPEGEEEAAAHHGRRCEARRRRRLWRYGEPFSKSRALGERGARGEFIPELSVAGEMTDTTDHGGAMADAHGAREQGPRGHETAQEKHREKEGEKEMLTKVKTEALAAQFAWATRGRMEMLRRRFLHARAGARHGRSE